MSYITISFSLCRLRFWSHSRFADQFRSEIPIIAMGRTASHYSETFHIAFLPPVISGLKGVRWSRVKRRRLIEVLVYFSTYVLQCPTSCYSSILVILSIWKFCNSSCLKAFGKSEKIRPMASERIRRFFVCFYIISTSFINRLLKFSTSFGIYAKQIFRFIWLF